MAISVPVPIAMPTSDCASAGASLIPSPTMAIQLATRLVISSPQLPSRQVILQLKPYRSPPACAIPLAVFWLSPVIMAMRNFIRFRFSNRFFRAFLDRVGNPKNSPRIPSIAINTTVLASFCNRGSLPVLPESKRHASPSIWNFQPKQSYYPIPPDPMPDSDVNSSGNSSSIPRFPASATIASPNGCSLAFSTEAANCKQVYLLLLIVFLGSEAQ